VTGHRFGPFSAIADRLYEPGREGLGTAELGLAMAIGFVCVVVTLLVRAVRTRHPARGWAFEARLGIVVVGALVLATKGGLSRPLELVGLSGVRAWSRIAIVVAFACVAVFARLLDRGRVALRYRFGRRSRKWWPAIVGVIVVLGLLDQSSSPLMPGAAATTRARLWHADGAFVAALQRRLPRDAMVFQLPVVDFPQHAFAGSMNAYDLIKEGYLHSTTLRWSTGGVRGRDGEWQFPAAQLPTRDLVRGVMAMGFSALMIDRNGLPDTGRPMEQQLDALVGPPFVDQGHLVAWDLHTPAAQQLLAGIDERGRHALVQQLLDAPRLYLTTDATPVRDRGDRHAICSTGTLTLVNPGRERVRRVIDLVYAHRGSRAHSGHVTVAGRAVPFTNHNPNRIAVTLTPGQTDFVISLDHFRDRCGATPDSALPTVSAQLEPVPLR
jgi:hypothetical protein